MQISIVYVVVKWIEEGAEEKVLQPTPVAAGPEQAEKIREAELTSGTLFKCPRQSAAI